MDRANRLRQSARFREIRNHGRWWSHPLLALGALPNDVGVTRCGFSVSKKLGHAVARNRARRRLREAVRLHWRDIPAGWDLVFAARLPLQTASFSGIAEAVGALVRRAAPVWRSSEEAGKPGKLSKPGKPSK